MYNSLIKFKPIIAGFLIFVIVFSIIFITPKKVKAQVPMDIIGGFSQVLQTIGSWVWEGLKAGWQSTTAFFSGVGAGFSGTTAGLGIAAKAEYIIGKALRIAFNVFKKKLLDMLVNDIVNSIQNGGNPRFIDNFGDFIDSAADDAAGAFISDVVGGSFLCQPFKAQINLLLTPIKSFGQGTACSLSGYVKNYDDMKTVMDIEGLDGFLKINSATGNPYTSALLIYNEGAKMIARAKGAAGQEAVSGQGFSSSKVCVEAAIWDNTGKKLPNSPYISKEDFDKYASNDNGGGLIECTGGWITETPGVAFAQATGAVMTTDIDYLISSKEANEYFAAIVDAAVNRLMKEGFRAMRTKKGTNEVAWNKKQDALKKGSYSVYAKSKVDPNAGEINQSANYSSLFGFDESQIKDFNNVRVNAETLVKIFDSVKNQLDKFNQGKENITHLMEDVITVEKQILGIEGSPYNRGMARLVGNECTLPNTQNIMQDAHYTVQTIAGNPTPSNPTDNKTQKIVVKDVGEVGVYIDYANNGIWIPGGVDKKYKTQDISDKIGMFLFVSPEKVNLIINKLVILKKSLDIFLDKDLMTVAADVVVSDQGLPVPSNLNTVEAISDEISVTKGKVGDLVGGADSWDGLVSNATKWQGELEGSTNSLKVSSGTGLSEGTLQAELDRKKAMYEDIKLANENCQGI